MVGANGRLFTDCGEFIKADCGAAVCVGHEGPSLAAKCLARLAEKASRDDAGELRMPAANAVFILALLSSFASLAC